MKKKMLVASVALLAAIDFTSAMDKLEPYDISNGLTGMKRDIILKLGKIVGYDSEKVRILIAMCKQHYLWTKHAYFLKGRQMLQLVPGTERPLFVGAEVSTGAAAAFGAVNAFLKTRNALELTVTNNDIARIALKYGFLAMSRREGATGRECAAAELAVLVLRSHQGDPDVVAVTRHDGSPVSITSIVLHASVDVMSRGAPFCTNQKAELATFLVNNLIRELGNEATRSAAADELETLTKERFATWGAINFVDLPALVNLLNVSGSVWITGQDDEDETSYKVCKKTLMLLNAIVGRNPRLATKDLLYTLPTLFSDTGVCLTEEAMKLLNRIVKTNPGFVTGNFVRTLILQHGDYNGDYSCKSGFYASSLVDVARAIPSFAQQIFDALFFEIIRHRKPHYLTILAVGNMVMAYREFATDGLYETLFPLLDHKSKYMRLRAADTLHEMVKVNPKFATEALANKLIHLSQNDPEDWVFQTAICALAGVLDAGPNFDTANIISTLTHATTDKKFDADERVNALWALQNHNKEGVAKFIEKLIHESLSTSADIQAREDAIRALRRVISLCGEDIDPKNFVDTLFYLSQNDHKMRKTAVCMLTELSEENIVDTRRLVDLLVHLARNLDDNVREAAVYALSRLLEEASDDDERDIDGVTSCVIDALVDLNKNNSNADVHERTETFLRQGKFYPPLFYSLDSILGLRDYEATGTIIPVFDSQNPLDLEEVEVPAIGDCGYHAIYYGINPAHRDAHEYDRSRTGEHRALLLNRVRTALKEQQNAQQVRNLIAQEMTARFVGGEIRAFFATTTLDLNALEALRRADNFTAIDAAMAEETSGAVEAYIDFLNNRPNYDNWLVVAPLDGNNPDAHARGGIADAIALVHNLHLVFVEGRDQAEVGKILHEFPNPGGIPVYIIQSSDNHYRAANVKPSPHTHSK
ncbi:hypothetical protein FACS189449_04670 [Alphaproteobacteria bacterium]|nr:hypothetical protein FACS189449_04670 [Alphaproteobacteria bacterium]